MAQSLICAGQTLAHNAMKRFFTSADAPSANLPAADRIMRSVTYIFTAALLTTSCIFDSPNDQFYRTLWICEESPFSNAAEIAGYGKESSTDASVSGSSAPNETHVLRGKLTIEFLCGESVCVTATGAVGSFGTYDTYGTTAYFANLRLNYYLDGPENNPLVIILEEAHRTDDLLLLSWHYSGSPVSYTTRLVRKGSYE